MPAPPRRPPRPAPERPARRPYQVHRAATRAQLQRLRPHYTAAELATLLGLRDARQVRDLCAAWGIRKHRPDPPASAPPGPKLPHYPD